MTLCCFSGGCDSTLALLEWARSSSENTPIHALSIGHDQVPNQKQQREARKAIVANLRSRGMHIKHTEVQIATDQSEFEVVKTGLIQPHMWLPIAVQYLGEEEDLVMGYIASDQVMHYKHDLATAFDALQRLGSKKGKLNLWLEWDDKAEVIRRLRLADLDKLVWYCEGDRSSETPCGVCDSCIAHQVGLYKLDQLPKAKPKKQLYGIHKSVVTSVG